MTDEVKGGRVPCPVCGESIAARAKKCRYCGEAIGPDAIEAPPAAGDVTGGVIPYKNMPALLAYYLAVFSLIPCIGAILGLAALFLGIRGLGHARLHPEARGQVHAWIGILVGGSLGLLWTALTLFTILSASTR